MIFYTKKNDEIIVILIIIIHELFYSGANISYLQMILTILEGNIFSFTISTSYTIIFKRRIVLKRLSSFFYVKTWTFVHINYDQYYLININRCKIIKQKQDKKIYQRYKVNAE